MIFLLFYLYTISSVVADIWYNPPGFSAASDFSENPVWLLGSTQNISCDTELDSWGVYMQQVVPGSTATPQFYLITGNSRSSQHSIAFNWSVSTYNFSQTAPQIYKFTIANDPTNVVDDVDSRTFNITTDSKAVSTSSTSATITITVPPSFTPNKGQTSSHTASTVGLGVGLGLGLPILMVLSTLLLILLRKRSAPQSTAVQPTVYTNIDTKTASLSTHDGRPGELNGSSSPVELPPPAQSLAEAPVEGNR